MKYVLVFAFNHAGDLILIRKNKPDWQAGKLNGVGGKVEEGEEFLDAAVREFREEANLSLDPDHLHPFLKMESDNMVLMAYTTVLTSEDFFDVVMTVTDEEIIYIRDARSLWFVSSQSSIQTVPNLKWIIPLALDFQRDPKMTTVSYKEEY